MEETNKITVDPKKLDVVDITLVRPNTWNPKDKDTKEFNDVKESIKANGLMGFIVVRENPLGDIPYEIIDGEQRYQSCVELGYTKICIYNEGIVEDKRARELTIWWQAQVPFNELSLAKLVTNMIETYGSMETYFSDKKLAEMQELAKFNFNQYKPAENKTPAPTGELMKNFMVQVTASQYEVIRQALEKARQVAEQEGVEEISDARALEFVCAEYLSEPQANIEEEIKKTEDQIVPEETKE